MALTIQQFYDAGRGPLKLDIISGEGHLGRTIPEASVNRPGLALAGFVQYFANRRVQVLGLAELTYLSTLAADARQARLDRFFSKHVPGVVVARNRHPPAELIEISRRHRTPILRSRMITMDLINQATLVLEDLTRPRERAHGTMVDVRGVGVMIEGDPGIGKSEAALSLIDRGGLLVADDVTVLHRDRTGAVYGTALESVRDYMEIRGIGLIQAQALFGATSVQGRKRLDLIVHLRRPAPGEQLERMGMEPEERDVFGVPIPVITLPVVAGRDLGLLIETAAMNQKMRMAGQNAADELDKKMIELLSGNRGSY